MKTPRRMLANGTFQMLMQSTALKHMTMQFVKDQTRLRTLRRIRSKDNLYINAQDLE